MTIAWGGTPLFSPWKEVEKEGEAVRDHHSRKDPGLCWGLWSLPLPRESEDG